jgi:hypothetical protein
MPEAQRSETNSMSSSRFQMKGGGAMKKKVKDCSFSSFEHFQVTLVEFELPELSFPRGFLTEASYCILVQLTCCWLIDIDIIRSFVTYSVNYCIIQDAGFTRLTMVVHNRSVSLLLIFCTKFPTGISEIGYLQFNQVNCYKIALMCSTRAVRSDQPLTLPLDLMRQAFKLSSSYCSAMKPEQC